MGISLAGGTPASHSPFTCNVKTYLSNLIRLRAVGKEMGRLLMEQFRLLLVPLGHRFVGRLLADPPVLAAEVVPHTPAPQVPGSSPGERC